jgi:hypothetical protein
MDDIHATLRAATQALREAETLVQARIASAAVSGHRQTDARIASELTNLRAATGDLHRAVAVLIAGPAGYTA